MGNLSQYGSTKIRTFIVGSFQVKLMQNAIKTKKIILLIPTLLEEFGRMNKREWNVDRLGNWCCV